MRKHLLIRRFVGVGVAAAMAVGAMLTAATPAAASGTWIRISAFHSGLVANVPSPWTTNDLRVEQRPYGANAYNGQWKMNLVGLGSDTFEFQNRYSNQCLDIENGNSTVVGSAVVQRPCDGTTSQKWTRWQDPNLAVWHIFNNWSGLYLGVEGGSSVSGADFVQLSYSSTSQSQMMQIW
jgi:hypothetical protein